MLAVVFQAIYVLSATGGSTYLTNTRTYWMALMMVISLVGTVMIRSIEHSNIWGRFMGYCLLIAFSANFPMSLTMVAANTGGFTKKTTVSAMVRLPPSITSPFSRLTRLGLHRLYSRQHHRPSTVLRGRSSRL